MVTFTAVWRERNRRCKGVGKGHYNEVKLSSNELLKYFFLFSSLFTWKKFCLMNRNIKLSSIYKGLYPTGKI
jgi:hypothetical protein